MINTKVSCKKYRSVFIFLLAAIAFAVVFCITFSMLTANAASAFSGGNGTSGNPYIISTEADLAQLADDVNSGYINDGYYGNYFKLNNDLDLSSYGNIFNSGKGWIPIGSIVYPFRGYFDGGNFSISNLYINDPFSNYLGLFGYIGSEGLIKNIILENSSVQGQIYIGGIAGQNDGIISGCISFASVKCTIMYSGGIAGYNDGEINNSVNQGNIITDTYFSGGIAGNNLRNINASYNSGIINGYSYAGGIAGNNSGDIDECFNIGTISGHDGQGGISGANDGNILNSYNKGQIFASTTIAGGIAGSNDSTGVIKNIYNIATVSAANIVGALAGINNGIIEAGFFDKEIYSGVAVGNGVGLESAGRIAYDLLSGDTLSDSNKLLLLASGSGTGKWTKRTYDSQYCYYPELNVFYNSAYAEKQTVSKTSVIHERTAISEADISLEKISFIYDGTAQKPEVLLGTTKLIRDLDYTAVFNNNMNVGEENDASITITLINYYSGSSTTRYFSITRAQLSIIWDESTILYNGTAQFPAAYAGEGKIGSENITFVYSGYESNINVGEYTVTVSLESTSINDNYYFESITHTYSIEKRPLTLTWDTEALIYSGNAQFHSAMVASGKIGTENITLVYSGYESNINAISGSTYTVVAALEDTSINANYSLEPQTHYYSISKKQITVTWNNSSLYYNANPQYPKINSIIGKVGDEDITFDYSCYSSNVNASSGSAYTVTASLANTAINANYDFVTEVKYYDISRAEISITWSDAELIYNGTAQHPDASVNTGAVNDEIITLEYYNYGSNINASSGATYTASVRLANTTVNANYTFTPETKNYSISKAPLTVAWSAGQLIYNGSVQRPSAYIVSGLYFSDTANLTYSGFSGLNAGTGHTITIESLNSNYYITNTLTYTINPAPITVDWASYELIYNGSVQRPNAVVSSGLLSGDTVGFEYTGYSGISAGSGYEITINSTNGNYYVQNALTYSISPSPITLTWDYNLSYNGQAQHPTATIGSGKVGEENIILEYYNFESNINASTGGAYTVNIRLADNEVNKNYVLSVTTKTYDISKAELTIAWKADIFYNGQNQHPEAIITSDIYDTVGLTYSNYNSVNAGDGYTILIESDNPNYIVINALSYSIGKAKISLEWNTSDLYYNGAAQYPTVTILSNIPGAESITFSYAGFENNIRVSSGNYYSVNLVLDPNNPANQNFYFGENGTYYYDILKKAININDVIGIERSYDGTLIIQLSGGELIGVLNGDTVSFILGNGELYDANAGNNKAVKTNIILSGKDAGQYVLIQPEDIFVKINKATYNLDNIVFQSKTFSYDGNAHSIYLENLLSGITAIYENNNQINIGTYEVVVKFILDDTDNYEQITNILSAYLYITQSKFEFAEHGIVFEVSEGYVDHGTTINVNKSINKSLGSGLTALELFDITFLKDNSEIQPNATVKITITLSEKTLKQKKLRLIHVNVEGGINYVEYEIINGQLIFYANSFSKYAIITEQKVNSFKYMLFGGLALLLLAGVSLYFVRKKLQVSASTLSSTNIYETAQVGNAHQAIFISDSEIEQGNIEIIDTKIINELDLAIDPDILDTEFYIDGVYCKSFVSFCESLKYKTLHRQIEVCALSANKAKRNALAKNNWEKRNELYWKDKKLIVDSKEHIELLERAKLAQTNLQIETDIEFATNHEPTTNNLFAGFEIEPVPKELKESEQSGTEFYIDGIYCKSFESFCESLKYKTLLRQIEICKLSAEKAKRNALGKNSWEKKNELYWRDKKFKPNSKEHLVLLEKAKAEQTVHLKMIATENESSPSKIN